MYDSIIIGVALFTEGSTSRTLIEKAAKMLNAGGRITLVHVEEPLPSFYAVNVPREHFEKRRKEAHKKLEMLATAAKGKRVETDLRSGNPAQELLDAAKDNKADLIMIASHSPDMRDYFIGSTASKIVRHAQCSVLVSRKHL